MQLSAFKECVLHVPSPLRILPHPSCMRSKNNTHAPSSNIFARFWMLTCDVSPWITMGLWIKMGPWMLTWDQPVSPWITMGP